jgi:hypothetical protein
MRKTNKASKRRRERDLTILLTLPRETPITLSEVAIIASVSIRHVMAERSLGRGPKTYNLGEKCLRSTVGDALSWVNSRAEARPA